MMEVTEISPFPVLREAANDDETSSANTEDQLISSRNSSETISSGDRLETSCCQFKKKKSKKYGPWCILLTGTILTLLGITSIIWTPFQIFMNERLRMLPGLPAYEWWKNPPDEVLLRVYVFNITNSEEFLNGTDAKLNLQEIGPIIFMEKLTHSNVTFNDNGTLSYVAKRTAIFLPEMNNIDLNQTLITPNLAVLGMASYLWDASFFTKFAFNLLVRSLQSRPIVEISINDYLWNFTDPILDVAQTVAPTLVPTKNMGILSRIYTNFEDLVTVYVGPENGHEQFFKIDKYDGSEYLPGYDNNCDDKVVNSTEGVAYHQFLTSNSTVIYWRKTLCKVTPLYYDSTLRKYGVDAFKFTLPNNTFDRTLPSNLDCYLGDPPLPNGLSDVSKCYFDFPMAASFPHFLHGDDVLHNYVDGLDPKQEKHGSFVIVEPITGLPMESRARSQSNLVMRELSGFNEIVDKFSDVVVPMFWAEYNQVGLPWYISALMYFTVAVLPKLQIVTTSGSLIVGVGLLLLSIRDLRMRNKRSHLLKNKKLQFEEETFVNLNHDKKNDLI